MTKCIVEKDECIMDGNVMGNLMLEKAVDQQWPIRNAVDVSTIHQRFLSLLALEIKREPDEVEWRSLLHKS